MRLLGLLSGLLWEVRTKITNGNSITIWIVFPGMKTFSDGSQSRKNSV
jgi:hypothetical protein